VLRFAHSITKDLNITHLYAALLAHIISKQTDQELLVIIKDNTKEKNSSNKDKEILKTLNLFNIDYSRVILQSENIKYHTGMGMKLLLDKKAFNCFCSKEVLEEEKEKAKKENIPYSYGGFCETISDETKFHCNAPFVVRIKKPQTPIIVTDLFNGELTYKPEKVDSLVILDHDKIPTDNFACAVDDMLYDISMVITDDRHLLDTPKQIHIRQSLGYDKEIKYIHIPNLLNNKSISYLTEEGYLPAAIANYLIFLGYNNPPKEIFTVEEACEWFNIDNISKKSAEFNMEKLNYINKAYINTFEDMRLSKILGYADEDIGKLAKLYTKECSTIKQIKEKIDLIFAKKEISQEYTKEVDKLKECLHKAPFMEDFENFKTYIFKQTGIKEETPLRLVLTGEASGVNLSDIYPLIKNYLGEIIC
jgi:glutamyl-tRNA synthetase